MSEEDASKAELADKVEDCMRRGFEPKQVQQMLELDETELIALIKHHFGRPKHSG